MSKSCARLDAMQAKDGYFISNSFSMTAVKSVLPEPIS